MGTSAWASSQADGTVFGEPGEFLHLIVDPGRLQHHEEVLFQGVGEGRAEVVAGQFEGCLQPNRGPDHLEELPGEAAVDRQRELLLASLVAGIGALQADLARRAGKLRDGDVHPDLDVGELAAGHLERPEVLPDGFEAAHLGRGLGHRRLAGALLGGIGGLGGRGLLLGERTHVGALRVRLTLGGRRRDRAGGGANGVGGRGLRAGRRLGRGLFLGRRRHFGLRVGGRATGV
jgi:hypothetical protein